MIIGRPPGATQRMPGAVGEGLDRSALSERICAASVSVLPVAGAAITVVAAAGHRGTVAASDETAARVEELQFTLGEGPCVDAFATGAPVLVSDFGPHAPVSARWPVFASLALAAGICAVYAFPLHAGAVGLGTYALYHDRVLVLGPDDLAEALWAADASADALLHLRMGATDAVATPLPRELAFYRAEVYQAIGMIMVQLGATGEESLVRLRAHAFAQGLPVDQVAREVVAGRLRFDRDDR